MIINPSLNLSNSKSSVVALFLKFSVACEGNMEKAHGLYISFSHSLC